MPSHAGLRASFVIGAGTAVLSCLIACALPRHRPAAAPVAPSPAARAALGAERLSEALAVAGD
ncbi:hypothetical protein [Pseudofrankia sp. DC12]|uniref:hypothetical protein n=1 Tax=Pseudofrankia sp. DC12 TaxID=683315 RepID=UPI0005F8501B|nr:hypothetical protein [Pseudofrankia sp. DC12]